MTTANQAFCNLTLALTRRELKQRGIKIGKLTTWHQKSGSGKWYEVWRGSDIVWQGSAYSAADAKSIYLASLLPDEDDY
jgi:hypothetical protein